MTDLPLWLIPLVPFAGFLVNGLVGRKAPKAVVTAVALIAALIPMLQVSAILWNYHTLALPYAENVGTWIRAGAFHADFAFAVDRLTLVMLCVVTGVGFIIHVYSVGYMAEEDGYWRFFAYMNLFLFFMLTLVLAENFLLMFVGWEGVGLASYLLIGFYFTKDSAANAGKKAFIVNRIGDFGFLLAMFLLVAHFGTLNFSEVFGRIAADPTMQGGFLTAIALFLVLGATGKSAQIPLYVWLPDAMEGPTPVSALIHAATMVTAGVYMIARTHVLFDRSPLALSVVAIIGCATAFFAATIGTAQTDIKRVLAYSTVSQLGYMFLACGVAAYAAGIFHLVTHAFFKALLFLAAGSVIHALSGEQDMRTMGGLRKKIPVTFWTMTAAVFAISGFPPLAGFVSKDEILYQAYVAPGPGKILWAVGLLTAGITSFYMFRLWYMTFFGESRAGEAELEEHGAAVHARRDTKLTAVAEPHAHAHPVHESPWVMLGPLVILAILSVVGGWMGWPEALGGNNWFTHWLSQGLGASEASGGSNQLEMALAGVSTLVALAGWFVAHVMYYMKPELPARLAQQLRAVYALVKNKYWVDEIYGALVVAPTLFVARYLLNVLIDRGVIDGGGMAAGYTAQGFGALVARIQSGNIRSYAGWLALFAALLLAASYFGWTAHFWAR
ncbi:MAG TPA: NADH-quinone oxidoreductase subunit L [Acidobacteriaceae bacterium]|nr:NADH-quinone oxidoreductase subunit L [Acidobacteriaceae bacterium]